MIFHFFRIILRNDAVHKLSERKGFDRGNSGFERLGLDCGQTFPESLLMSRMLRKQYPGAMARVMSHGDRRHDICPEEVGRRDFIGTLAEAYQRKSRQVRVFRPMPQLLPLGDRNTQRQLGREEDLVADICSSRLKNRQPTNRTGKPMNDDQEHAFLRSAPAGESEWCFTLSF